MTRRVAILTVSDGVAAGRREDRSGALAAAWVAERGWQLTEHRVVADEAGRITGELLRLSGGNKTELILTLGGTGLGPRDVTPEATAAVIERHAPGLAEALRADGMLKTPHAMLSRGVAGVRGNTLIINLPGSEKAVSEGLALLTRALPHALDLLAGHTQHV